MVSTVFPSSVRVTTLCCISRDLRCRPDRDSKLGASALSSLRKISAYFVAVAEVPNAFEGVEAVAEVSNFVKDPFEEGLDDEDVGLEGVSDPLRGVGGLLLSLNSKLCGLLDGLSIGGGISWDPRISCELRVSSLKDPVCDDGLSLRPSMLFSPNPLDLRCSCLASFSSRCFSASLMFPSY
jgi:hypothetical protein